MPDWQVSGQGLAAVRDFGPHARRFAAFCQSRHARFDSTADIRAQITNPLPWSS
jgi:hypothetical protein